MLLAVHIQPRASKDCIDGLYGDRLKIRITAPPVDNKANAHLVRYLAQLFGVPRNRVTLLSGAQSRAKRVRIQQPGGLPAVLSDLFD